MSRLADDLALLQRAADTAALVFYPGGGNRSYGPGNITAPPDTLRDLGEQLAACQASPAEHPLIGYEAVWLLQSAHQALLHRLDGNVVLERRFREFGMWLRAAVEVDLDKARRQLDGGA